MRVVRDLIVTFYSELFLFVMIIVTFVREGNRPVW